VSPRRRISAALIGLLVLVAGGAVGRHALTAPPIGDRPPAVASTAGLPVRALPVRALSQLPPQVAQVWQLIQHGGPFRYRQDGAVFGNREGHLPPRPSGFYREYTVPTPGEHDRGPRRLITGDGTELYYTGNHYASFVAVDPRR
jgi:ribonuclease T1